ncbi:MAG TPA: amino acid adenylation domain-containing protein, partial [Thermoanaerobaculia bacterium]|nr:amino acid adenylation domain-containing protein [Thermoanaerobaculia bacterium]
MDILERRSQLSPEKRVLLEKLLRGQAAADAGGIPRRPAGSRARLSFSQERLWFLDRLLPGTPAYNVPGVVRLRGDLDSSALEASLAEVVRRHEALRTVFLDEGGAVVQETAPAGPFELPRVDLRPLGAEEREIEVRRLALEEARGSFDLGRADRGPLLRARLLRLADDEHLLLLCLHHIAADGWSVGVLLSELATLYEAFRASRPSPLPPLPLQYADFAEWQRERLQGETLDELLRFWKELLAGSPQALDLPTDHPRPAVQSFRGARWPFHVEEGVADAVRALAREERTTPFGVLLAVFEVFLSRWAGQRELLVGSPVAGRSRAELHGLIGFFVNTLVYRGELADDPSVRRLVERTGAQAVAVLAHQELPFERLVAELRPDRSLSHSPLVQAMFVFQNAPTASVALPGLTLERLNVDNGTAKFDLTLEIADGTPALAGWLEFSLDLFEPATAERMVQGFQHLLRIAMAQPDRSLSELDPLGEEERQQLLYAWNGSGTPQVEETACLHELFAAQAARTPGAPALDYGSEEISYDELAHRAGELARHLSGLGVGPETLVGLCCRRTPEMVAAMLGILKAGGAYVPLDPNYPEAVLRGMLEEAKVELVLAEESFVSLLLTSGVRIVPLEGAGSGGDTGEALSPCRCAPTPENLAYLIFTSGSTGHPKAVAIQHRSAAALLRWAAGRFAPEELDGVLASTSICFDLSVFEIFLPLSLGGRIVLAGNALELPSLPARNRVRLVTTVPSAIAELERAGALPASVRTVNLAGEPLSRALVDQVYGAASVERVWNLYGPSEDTTYSTATLVPAGTAEPPTIGRPIAGTRLYLLDADLLPVPRGARGEICLGGAGLARGYLHRPERTAERFIPDAWSGLPGERLYRTGDLGRLRLDGEVEFLGRVDRQVKIRGFRVEPGEIEAALRRHPAVGEAVVLARADGPGPKRLVAYVTGAEGARPCPPAEMRSFLSGRLPEHMLPSALVWLDAFPLTPNGKIDWRRLPAPDERPAELAYTPPRTPTEELLAELWADVLGLERVGVEDDFFALGGHSLLATRVVSGVRRAFGVELPLRSLFEAPTVAALAARFDALQQPAAERRLPGLAPVAPRPEHPPLSFAQERLWFLDQYEPGSGAWNLPSVLRLRGRLDHAAFEAALEELVRRHEALRTAVDVVDGRPVQRVAPAAGVPLPGIDLGALPADVREAELARLTVREAAAPFDLTAAPLLRARLVRLGGQEHALLLNLHHIAADGWSIQILIREIGALYTAFAGGLAPALPELPVQYVDYALWQRELVSGELLEGQLAYWTQRLAGAPDLLDLPTDFQRPAVQTFTGGRASLTLPAELAGSLRSLGRGAGATFFMTLLAAFEVVLARWSGEDDILVGIPIAGRTRAEVEGLIGCFLNTLVLRTDLSGNPDFLTVLRRVRETTLEAYSHQDLPFERLLEAVRPQRDLSRTPLFQVFFNMLNYPESEIRLPGLEVELLALPEVPSKFDLTVYLAERDGGLAIDLVYNADLFSARRAADLLAQMERVLAHAAGAPEVPVSRCSLVTAAMAERLPDPAAPLSDAWHGSVHERFERQARRVPANLAVSDSRERWTYAELDARSNQLAHVLVSSGVRPGEVVALYAHRSATLVWAVLGVLKAGAAFLLIDPVYPARRTVACLRIASPRGWLQLAAAGPEPAEIAVALDELPLACRLELAPRGKGPDPLAGSPEHSPGISVGPDDLAYVAFTSGSTGTPKGILGRQGPLSHFLPWQEREFGFGEEDRFSMLSGLSHDPLHRDLFTPLQLGAAICVPDPESLGEPGWLARWMAREEVTVTHLTPAMGQLLTEPAPGGETVTVPSLRWALLVGDALTRSDVARLERLAPRITCVNLYGSTETQRAVGYHVVQRGESATSSAREILPLGRGIEDVQLLVLNRAGDLAGLGELGEVALRSPHLAAGYLGLPELTAERFVVNPWTGEPGDRLYRTGDLGRYLPDGEVASAGRADQQVKIRGFRVEPGEIEAALARHPAVLEAAVIAAEDGGGERRLAAYVVPRPEPGGVALSVAELRAFLAERVPDYMVP